MNKISLISLALSFLFTGGCMYAHSSGEEESSNIQGEVSGSDNNSGGESTDVKSDDSENKETKKTKRKRNKKAKRHGKASKHSRSAVKKGDEYTAELNRDSGLSQPATEEKSK